LADGGITEEVVKEGRVHIFLSFLVLPLETFLGQSGPIWVFAKIGVRSHYALCVLSAIVFALLHLSTGVMDVLSAFFAGLVLTYCWLSWRPGSFALAFWGTTLVHVAHNAIVFPLFVILDSLDPNLPS
jgi:hypothetical protein